MTIMLLAALASEKALPCSDIYTTSTIPGAANDALIGRVDATGGDLPRTNVRAGQDRDGEPRVQPIEPDGFPIAL